MSNGERYAKFYGGNVQALSELSSKQLLMYIYLASEVKMSNNELPLTRSDKDRAARAIGIKPKSVNNILSKYCRLNLMTNIGGGVFVLNPGVTNRSRHPNLLRTSMSYVALRSKIHEKKIL
jgi:hypothetical protein